jgi:TorA maturation chaperone TorD
MDTLDQNQSWAQSQNQNEASTAELAELMRGRAATYATLSRIFRRELDQEALDALIATGFPAHSGNRHVDAGARLMVDYLGQSWENTVDELAVDYVRTFIGGGNDGFAAAYPFESVYTSEKRLLMQQAYLDVLAVFRKNGIVRAPDDNEEADHVALELEFVQILCRRAAEAFESGDMDRGWSQVDEQRRFVERHLFNWVPMLVEDINKFSQTDFYRGAGEFLLGYLQTEHDFLAELAPEALDDATTAIS